MLRINQINESSNLSAYPNTLPATNLVRTSCLALASFLVVSNNSKAFDLNGDGMSDVWQRHYNVAVGARLQDPDSDGYANWQEEAFGTNPNSAISRPEIKLQVTPLGTKLFIPTVPGVFFYVHSSSDLKNWTARNEYGGLTENPIQWNGGQLEINIQNTTDRFFRLQAATPKDEDRDRLNSYEESFLGLSDYQADYDRDGLSDGWEVAYGLPPKVFNDFNVDEDGDGYNLKEEAEFFSDPNSADFDGDGLDDKAEGLYGLNTNLKDSDGDGIFDGAEFRRDVFLGELSAVDHRGFGRWVHDWSQTPPRILLEELGQAAILPNYDHLDLKALSLPSSKIARYNFIPLPAEPNNPFHYKLYFNTTFGFDSDVFPDQANVAHTSADLRVLYPVFTDQAKGKLNFVIVGREHTGFWLEDYGVVPTLTAYEFVTHYAEDISAEMPAFKMDGGIWKERIVRTHQYVGPIRPDSEWLEKFGTYLSEFRAVHVEQAKVFKDGEFVPTVTPMRNGETNLIYKAGTSHNFKIEAKHFVDDELWPHFSWSFDGLPGNVTKQADGSSATVSIASLETAHTITLKLFDKVLWEWNVYPCQILGKDEQNNFAETKDELKIAKLQESLDTNNTLHVDNDNDAIKVKIVGGAKMESFTGKIGTLSIEGNLIDDLTNVTFTQSGTDLLSQGLILVQDDADDIYSNNGVGEDNAPDDKTHHAQLGGEFLFTSSEEGEKEFSRWTVPVKKEMNVNIFVLRENGVDSVSQEILGKHIISALNVYSQIGLKLNFNVQFADKPEGLDLTNGLMSASNNPKLPSRGQEILIESLGTTDVSDLTVFYVPNFTDDNVKGEAIYPLVFNSINQRYQNNVFVSGTAQRAYTLAHEIGHVLTNQAHFVEDYPNTAGYQPENNVMFSQAGQVIGVGASKRLTIEQEEMIFNNDNFNEED